MDSWVTFLIEFMISHLWQGFLLVALLSLVLHIRKHDSAASRFTAWLIVLLVMMLMPLLVLLPEQAESSGVSAQPLPVTVESEFDQAWQQALGSAESVPAAVGSHAETASSGIDLARIGMILLVPLWLFLMAWQCRQLWRAWVSMRRSRDQSSPCDASVQTRLDELPYRHGYSSAGQSSNLACHQITSDHGHLASRGTAARTMAPDRFRSGAGTCSGA